MTKSIFEKLREYQTLIFCGIPVLVYNETDQSIIFNEFFEIEGKKLEQAYSISASNSFVKTCVTNIVEAGKTYFEIAGTNRVFKLKRIETDHSDLKFYVANKENLDSELSNDEKDNLLMKEKQFKVAVDAAGIGTWHLDKNQGINYVNEHWANMLGYSLDEVNEDLDFFMDRVHPDDFHLIEEAIENADPAKECSFDAMIRMKTKKGEYKYIRDIGIYKLSPDGQNFQGWGVHIDVDASERRKESLQLYSQILETASSPKLVIRKKSDQFDLLFANESFRKLWPISSKKEDLYKVMKQLGLNKELEKNCKDIKTDGREVVGLDTAEGNKFFKIDIDIIECQQFDDKIFIEFTDVTKLREVNESLQDQIVKINLAVKMANIGIWDIDIKTRNIVWDKGMRDIYGKNITSIQLDSWLKFVQEEDKEQVMSKFAEALEREENYLGEFSIKDAKGKVKRIESSCTFIKNSSGETIRAIGIDHDITARKSFQDNILQMNAMLEQIVWMHSHELREPISQILGLAELSRLDSKKERQDEIGGLTLQSVKELDKTLRSVTRKTERLLKDKTTK